MDIGTVSSIATLILFVFYFVGRTWTLFKNIEFPLEGISAEVVNADEIDNFMIDLGGSQIIKVMAENNLQYLEIRNCKWNNSGDSIKLEERISEKLRNLAKGQPIYIKCEIPEGVLHNAIVFQRYDGLKGVLGIAYDGRTDGKGVSFSCNKLQLTPKAIIYNLVR